MSVSLSHPGPAPSGAEPAFLSRQPVLDAQRRVTGYRIHYAAVPGEAPTGDHADTRLFGDIISVVGLEELVGEALAHLTLSRSLLLTLGIPPVRPDRVVLRIAHAHAVDPELSPLIEGLADRGYSLCLYDLPGPLIDARLLELYGIVEVDVEAWTGSALATAVQAITDAHATALAVGLGSSDDFTNARALGCSLFAGSFFASPRTTEIRDVPVGALSTLAAVARLQGAGSTIEDLEAVIDRDLGLSVKLLRYINSAYFGMRSKITSIRQAIMMLGARGVSRWALMVSLTGGRAAPAELSLMALTRGRMCELLAAGRGDVAGDEMFLIGLLSLADALLDTPLDTVVAELPLAEHVSEALLHRSGPAGEILDAVTSYELGRFGAPSVQAYSDTVSAAYLDALRWARETTTGIG